MSDRVSMARRVRRVLGKVRRRVRGSTGGGTPSRRADLLRRIDAFQPPQPQPGQPQIVAAVAAGAQVTAGLAWEWTQRELTAANAATVLRADDLDLVLLEMSGSTVRGWSAADGAGLDGVLAAARERAIPVLAWVTAATDDPDAAEGWIDDVRAVFLDDAAALEKWRARWPDAAVRVLPPAVQPRVHNPLVGGAANRRQRAIAVQFHGATDADDAVADVGADRVDVWAAGDDAAAALDRSVLRSSAVSGRRLPADQPVLSRYRALAEVGAGAGPPSWTVVQAAACQTPVIVQEQGLARVPEGLRDAVTVAADADAVKLDVVARLWQDELRDREGVRLGRAVRAGHTFANAVDVLAEAGGVAVPQRPKAVSAVVPTNRKHELDNVFGNIARQAHAADGGVELVLVLHGMDVADADIKARAADAGVDSLTVLHADASLPLGGCMNLGIDASGGDFIAKMDDDNYYGRHYLTDLVAAFDSTGAGIVGKWAHYVWLRSTGAVVLRNPKAEHRFERLVQGGSIVLTADVARQLRFGDDLPRGVDTDILNRAKEAGVGTYSADRFNYVSIRGTDRHAHTWAITDTALLNRAGTLAFYGDPCEHVEV